MAVRDLIVIPSTFLTTDVIVRRPPLRPEARRAGWVGCNIRIADIPDAGRIPVVRDGIALPRANVVRGMRLASTLPGDLASRTWLVDTLRCIERLGPEFALPDLYAHEAEFRRRHPGNNHIRPKLRQQLQRLRDSGVLTFLGKGRYRLAFA